MKLCEEVPHPRQGQRFPRAVSRPVRANLPVDIATLAWQHRLIVRGTQKQFSLTRTALSTCRCANKQISISSFVPCGSVSTRLLFLLLIASLPVRGWEAIRWIGATDGNWSNPANWDLGRVPNNVGGAAYKVIWDAPAVTVHVDIPISVLSLSMRSGGTLDLVSSLHVFDNGVGFHAGTITGDGAFLNENIWEVGGASGTRRVLDGRSLTITSTLSLQDSLELRNRPAEGRFSHLNIAAGGRLVVSFSPVLEVVPDGTRSHIDNAGSIDFSVPVLSKADILNHASMIIQSTLTLTNSDVIQDAGTLSLTNASILNRSSDPAHGKVLINSGLLQGNGQIDVANIGAVGQPPVTLSGRISFKDVTIANTTFSVRIGGVGRDQFDHISASHQLTYHPRLEVDLADGFGNQIQRTDVFEIVTAESGAVADGAFENVAFGQRIKAGNFGTLLVDHAAGNPASVVLRDFIPIQFAVNFSPGPGDEYPLPVKTYFIAPTAEVSEQAPVTWTGGSLRLDISLNYDASQDHLAIQSVGAGPGQISTQRDPANPGSMRISYQGVVFATTTGFLLSRDVTAGSQLVCSLSNTATTAAIQALLRSCIYTNDVYGFDAFTNDLTRTFADRAFMLTLSDPQDFHATGAKDLRFPKVLTLACIPSYINITPSISKQLTAEAIFDNIMRTESAKVGSQIHYAIPADPFTDCDSLPILFTVDAARPEVVHVSYVGTTSPDDTCTIVATAGPFTGTACLRITSLGPGVVHCTLDESDKDAAPDCPIPLSPALSASSVGLAGSSGSGLIALASFHALESLMKETAEGHRLVDLYWRHTTEWVYICVAHPELFRQTRDVLQRWQPSVNTFLAGKGSSALINQSMITALNLLLNQVTNYASPELRADMNTERTRFNGFQDFLGKNFTDWAQMLQIPAPVQPRIFLSNAKHANGRFTAEANLISGATHSILRSINLIDWTILSGSALKTNGFTLNITDPTPPPTNSFYRLLLNPTAR
jgi:hypothetical protein